MSKKKNIGKIFQDNWAESCKKEKVVCHRFRDVFIPPEFRSRIKVPKNKYDFIVFGSHHEFPLELKSTDNNKFSFSESIIKQHQIDDLTEINTYKDEGIIAGFIFNFRQFDNETWFIHIEDFNKYKHICDTDLDHDYVKLNKRSIPIEVCRQIGMKINNYKKKTNYHYHVHDFIHKAIERFGNRTTS